DREPIPPWSSKNMQAVLKKIEGLHNGSLTSLIGVDSIFDSELNKELIEGKEGWISLSESEEMKDGFSSLHKDSQRARKWLDKNLDTLIGIEGNAKNVKWNNGVIHLDLRSDNILFSTSRGPLLVDWPNICIGPRALDLAAFFPSVKGEGGELPQINLKV